MPETFFIWNCIRLDIVWTLIFVLFSNQCESKRWSWNDANFQIDLHAFPNSHTKFHLSVIKRTILFSNPPYYFSIKGRCSRLRIKFCNGEIREGWEDDFWFNLSCGYSQQMWRPFLLFNTSNGFLDQVNTFVEYVLEYMLFFLRFQKWICNNFSLYRQYWILVEDTRFVIKFSSYFPSELLALLLMRSATYHASK